MNRFRVSGSGSLRSGLVCLLALTLSLSLAGCVQESAGISASTSAPSHMAARPGTLFWQGRQIMDWYNKATA